MYLTYFESSNLAVMILAFIGGLALSIIIRARGITGCLTYILSLVILVIIISGLVKGYSIIIEDATFYLQEYIYYNGIGVLGFLVGFVFGLIIKRRR